MESAMASVGEVVKMKASVDEFVDALYGITREERNVLNEMRGKKLKRKLRFNEE